MSRLGLAVRMLFLAAGMLLAAGLSAWVVFSFLTRGGEATVPDLTGHELKAALELASRQELGLRISGTGHDTTTPPGYILSQDPRAGTRIRKNRIVRVVVSQGTPTVFVPALAGLTLRRAELQLAQAGLSPGKVSRSFSDRRPTGAVVAQNPPPGRFVARGQAVDLLLGNGPRPRAYLLPDLTGFPLEDVLITLRGWGLRSGRIMEVESNEMPPGTVAALEPSPGSALVEGQSVHLTVTRTARSTDQPPVILYQYSAPPGLIDRTLTIELETEGQSRTVYEGTVQPGTSVAVPISIPEPGTMRVYVNGSFLEEKQVP